MQWWMPSPKARCRRGSRVMLKTSGSGKRRSSRFAEPVRRRTVLPPGRVSPSSSISASVVRLRFGRLNRGHEQDEHHAKCCVADVLAVELRSRDLRDQVIGRAAAARLDQPTEVRPQPIACLEGKRGQPVEHRHAQGKDLLPLPELVAVGCRESHQVGDDHHRQLPRELSGEIDCRSALQIADDPLDLLAD
jgi:hypothetical protein